MSKKIKKSYLKVALVSFLFEPDIEKNLSTIEKKIKEVHKKGVKLVCFSECALTGLPTESYKIDIEIASQIPGETTERISEISRKYRIYIAIGLLERVKGKIYDTAILFNDKGEIILKYRRINPGWHSKRVSDKLYVEGKTFKTSLTPFGKISFAICGDIFDENVVNRIKRAKPDLLIVPMFRSFGEECLSKKDWEEKEKWIYASQVKKIGVLSLLINAFEKGEYGSFGGCMIISKKGEILAETEIGKPSVLINKINLHLPFK